MNVNDIIEANEELKSIKEEIADTPIVKNTVGGTSADSIEARQAMLPSEQETFKLASRLQPMFDTTSRAGAGGTRIGVPGIRPHGGKAASRFLDDYTGTGRIAPEKKMFQENEPIKQTKKVDTPQVSVALYKQCPDCHKPVSKDDAVPNITYVLPPEHTNPYTNWEAVRLRPGEIIGYLICGPCVRDAMKEAQRLNAVGVSYFQNGQEVKAGQRYLHARGKLISENVYDQIKRERDNPDTDVFYGMAATR